MQEHSSGEKKVEFRQKSFTIENYTTEEILNLAEKNTGKKYILVCNNDCNVHHTYSLESQQPYQAEAFEKMVASICKTDRFILMNSSPQKDLVIYDSSLEKATFELFNPEILASMGLEDKNNEDLKHMGTIKRINNKYFVWNHSVDHFCDYYYKNTGVQITNATTYASDQKLYFEYNGKETKSKDGILYVKCLCNDSSKVVKHQATQRLKTRSSAP